MKLQNENQKLPDLNFLLHCHLTNVSVSYLSRENYVHRNKISIYLYISLLIQETKLYTLFCTLDIFFHYSVNSLVF